MGQVVLGLVFHNHQPIGNFGWVNEEHYAKAYAPMVAALERHPGVRVGLHYTGSLLDWLRMTHPDLLDRIRALAERGR
jgi:alpha-amylase/alpha-mannosidase (GH57 family)